MHQKNTLIILISDLIFNKIVPYGTQKLVVETKLTNKLKLINHLSEINNSYDVIVSIKGYYSAKDKIDLFLNERIVKFDEFKFSEFYKHYKSCRLFYTDNPKILSKKSKIKCINFISNESKVIMQESFHKIKN